MGNPVYIPNLKSPATGATVTDASLVDHDCLDVFVRNDASNPLEVNASLTESAVSADGGSLPALVKVAGGYDGTNVQVLHTNSSGDLQVDVLSTVLPTGASTSAKQDTGNTSLASIDGKIPSNLTVTSTRLLVDNSGVTQPISAASLPLPTGAATSANQTTANSSLSSIDGKVPSNLTVSSTRLLVDPSGVTSPISAASLPLPTGAATSAKQPALGVAGTASSDVITVQGITGMTALKVDGSAVTQPVSVAAAVPTKSPVNTNGQVDNTSLTATTATTASVPANAIGFVLEAPSTNTDNIRYRVGGTASTTAGMLMEPGRDTGFIPCAANVSVCATASGTNVFSIFWILSA